MELLLEPEQEALLIALVEAARNVPRERRQKFYALESHDGTFVQHEGLPNPETTVYMGDVEVLGRAGLLRARREGAGTTSFDVTPAGFEHYRRIKQRVSSPVERVQTDVRDYLSADPFRLHYPEAFRKWSEAETLLWESDSAGKLTTIGHLCREAMQAFAGAVAERDFPGEGFGDKAKTVDRLRAVLQSRTEQLGSTERRWLDALLVYWRTVSDLVQRQEHDTQREGGALTFEDGRRVVFQTMLVMYEIDRSLSCGA